MNSLPHWTIIVGAMFVLLVAMTLRVSFLRRSLRNKPSVRIKLRKPPDEPEAPRSAPPVPPVPPAPPAPGAPAAHPGQGQQGGEGPDSVGPPDRPRISPIVALRPTTGIGAAPDATRFGSLLLGGLGFELAPVFKEVHGLEANEYRVWFGTNRKPVDPSDMSRGFSGARDKATHYGHCDVFVPESHKIGSVGSSWMKRLLTRIDDRLRLRRLGVLDRDSYWQALGRQLAEQAPGQRHALVFVHGYNVSFEEAAIRAAQIGFDLGVGGAMAFFSWPSRGKTGQYIADGAAIEASEAAIADFLADFGRRTGADFVHVIAHSMGNRGLLRAINRIFADAERRSGCAFGEFILAAADVDADTFGQLAGAYRQMAMRTTLYVSGRDRAVELSKWIHDYPRIGFAPPISIFDGIDTVSVTEVDLSRLGHGYIAAARPVLTDMHALIFRGQPPEERGFLKERKTDQGQRYWEVRG